MEESIRVFAAITFLVIGLSHIFQHRVWAEYFVRLHGMGKTGAFVNGSLSMITGALIVAFHNVWTWPAALLTALGWSFVLKAVVSFLRPDWALKSMSRVGLDNSYQFIFPGLIMVAVSVVLAYASWIS